MSARPAARSAVLILTSSITKAAAHNATRATESQVSTSAVIMRPTTLFSHQRETLAQIDPSHFGIAGQLAGLAVTENSAVIDDVGSVGH